ncbi:MAG TPA: HAD family hydrolase [Vulgatibacter sp.]
MLFPAPPATDRQILHRVLETARRLGRGGIAVFDLDSTLIDNKPRQARILREIGELFGVPELARSTLEHWGSSWDIRGAMSRAGLEDGAIERIFADAMRVWAERFFTDEYCVHDCATPGAREFLARLTAAGARIVYCTGRPELMRRGTSESFGRFGFPVPDGEQVSLLMKPHAKDGDDEFKREVQPALRALGEVFAAFDNEPSHVNGYRLGFPEAHVVHLATDHSGRDVAVAAGIPAIADFLLP